MDRNAIVILSISASVIISICFSFAWAQAGPPEIDFIFPTAANGTEPANRNYIVWNVSFSEDIGRCKIEINGTNYTGTTVVSGPDSYCYYNETGIPGSATRCAMAHANDTDGEWNTTLFMVCRNTADTAPPSLRFVPPTPGNNTYTQNEPWVFINVSGTEPLSSCLLDNGTANLTMIPGTDSTWCWHNLTGQANGTEIYVRAWASDTSGNLNVSSELNVTVNLTEYAPDLTPPIIESHEITPLVVQHGRPVNITVSASDDRGIGSVWANITEPTDPPTYYIIGLVNGDAVEWQTGVIGTYAVTIFASDTSSNEVNVTDAFYVNVLASINITVINSDEDGLETDLEIYVAGTSQRVFDDNNDTGEFREISIVQHEYDMLFEAFDDQLEVMIRGVSVSPGLDGKTGLDYTSADGFDDVFAADVNLTFSDALIKIDYDDMGFSNETNINAYLCDDWDFYDSACYSGWAMIDDAVRDTDHDAMEFTVDRFSAFALREDTWCGDGSCGPGENATSCPSDCECNEGDTKACSELYAGICAVGEATCRSNIWTGCPQPTTETCNYEDDDCDGIIDDVNNGNSVAATKCQCYNGRTPQGESCNGIDDDCDGLVDNDANCCTGGQSRECGPSTDEGECVFGTSTCSGGVWGTCMGAVYPEQEICGDGRDNDCDGETDESCQAPQCGEGRITQRCLCEGSARTSGYCCSGVYSEAECIENLWWLLIAAGVAMLVILAILILRFRSQGRELTWEELMKKYTPAEY
jgi:hypothetical protein